MNAMITFNSPHLAMAAEKLCEKSFTCRLIPLPTDIDAGCGLAMKILLADWDSIKKLLSDENLPINNIYKIIDDSPITKYEVIL